MDLLKELNLLSVSCANPEWTLPWLNDFCGEFSKFCAKLHRFLPYKHQGREFLIETSLVSAYQVTTCVKYMEKIIQAEEIRKVTLTVTRQYFLDRVLSSLGRLQHVMYLSSDKLTDLLAEQNFIHMLDKCSNLISPYTNYMSEEEYSSITEEEILSVCDNLREISKKMLSQVLTFANVALTEDKRALTVLCNKVYRELSLFFKEFTPKEGFARFQFNTSAHRLQAALLETAMRQMETVFEDSLVRLICTVCIDYSKLSMNRLKLNIKTNPNDSSLDERIANFDINLDRILQIGLCIAAFAPNNRVKTAFRSSLTSLESLDTCLIPSYYMKCEIDTAILEEHYHEEMKIFQMALHEIIDTKMFVKCLYEAIDKSISTSKKEKIDKESFDNILEMSKIIKTNLQINSEKFCLNENNDKSKRYQDFLLMLDECSAVLSCADQLPPERVMKRFNIFRSTVRKLHKALENYNQNDSILEINDEREKLNIIVNSDEFNESVRALKSFGIVPSPTSKIFYNMPLPKLSTEFPNFNSNFNLPKFGENPSERHESLNSGKEVKIPRRISLRRAIFKKQNELESKAFTCLSNDISDDLHITDILEQLTDLSSSFESKA